ncbi:hypothetical protein [Mycolicibacter sinensis]|uniref:Uncharacterized protein n=1 Tax=Mycolicibacter sinensis (strain JDM601) TaxID=875328 RepID=A0A1A3TUM2_MYCSD|nr:hypothetical protein [Mycolicibacter sinensis]OBK86340.1 hypothetical protein A5648_05825 [Mycolicibacter sinensis]
MLPQLKIGVNARASVRGVAELLIAHACLQCRVSLYQHRHKDRVTPAGRSFGQQGVQSLGGVGDLGDLRLFVAVAGGVVGQLGPAPERSAARALAVNAFMAGTLRAGSDSSG